MTHLPSLVAALGAALSASAHTPSGPVTSSNRVYAAEQFSNTVSVTDPATNRLIGLIRLGEPTPANLSPLYRGQLLVHGLGVSPDGRTLAVVSVGSNAVTFIDTATNAVKRTTYIGRSPHEAAYTRDGRELWVTVRGEDYISVISAETFQEIARIQTPPGPGMVAFSPDGRLAYVCSSFTTRTVVVETARRRIVGDILQPSAFCPNLAATPDGRQVWFTLKDIGQVVAFEASPPFRVLTTLSTGPITNHVQFARTAQGQLAYVTVGGLNVVKVFRTDDFTQIATVPVGALPHGLWPSPDGTRLYVGLENANQLAVIDTSTNRVIENIDVGQAPQAVGYASSAVPQGPGDQNLQPRDPNSSTVVVFRKADGAPSTTTLGLFDQGLVQVLQGAVEGLAPRSPYVLALADKADGSGALEPIAAFTTNPAGAAIVNAIGPIRRLVRGERDVNRRYLVIAPGTTARPGSPVLLQSP